MNLLKRSLWSAVVLPAFVGSAGAEVLWSNNFNYSPVTDSKLDVNEAAYSSQYGGSRAGDIVLRSAKVHQQVTGTELQFIDHGSIHLSGAIRFHAVDAVSRFDFSSGSFGTKILAAGGFEVSFDWTPTGAIDENWIGLSVGIREDPGDRNMDFLDGETDMGILLRRNGGVQTKDSGGIRDGRPFDVTTNTRHVVMQFSFDSFADGSLVVMSAWVDDQQVIGGRTQTWGAHGANNGKIYITMENWNADWQLLDNLAISTLSLDVDGDNLPDAWETFHGLSTDPTVGAAGNDGWLGDPDGDGYANHAEQGFGTNPLVADDLTGKLAREAWLGISGDFVRDLQTSPKFLSLSDHFELVDGAVMPSNYAENFGERLRGWVTAPETGDYIFWLSGDNESELWLSTTESKFDRVMIANVPYWTAPLEWDKFLSQQSVSISLVAGQKYYLECLHKDGISFDSLAVAWATPSNAVGEVIPSAYLSPYFSELADQDNDEMPDSWEIATFGDTSQNGGDNPDGDYGPNWEEYLYGTDPLGVDSNVGHWTVERWLDMPHYAIPELVQDKRFYGPPTSLSGMSQSSVILSGSYAGARARGYIEVDETAEYHFWISAQASADLLLSTDDTPYRKRRIAYLGTNVSTEHGLNSASGNLWDVFASQMSAPVLLEAGQKYYLEAIQQIGHSTTPHIQIAWAKIGGERTFIPARNMSSYIGLADDADDDALPDSWESQFGLDPLDNGFTNLAQEGERGDYDHDGLSNREEFLYGSDPTLVDTDGDGLSDADEVRTYGTDPAVSDSTTEMVVDTVAPDSVATLGTDWFTTPDGVQSSAFRGNGLWNFNVPQTGHWVL